MATRHENWLAALNGELMEIASSLERSRENERNAQQCALNALALLNGGKEDYLPEPSDETLETLAQRARNSLCDMPRAA